MAFLRQQIGGIAALQIPGNTDSEGYTDADT
jgi:hypothetical protein